jgi:hypothetical protein
MSEGIAWYARPNIPPGEVVRRTPNVPVGDAP